MKYESYRIMPLSEKCPFYFKAVTDDAETEIYFVRREGDEVKGSMLLWSGEPKTRKQAQDIICRWCAYMNEQCWSLEEAGDGQ